MRAYKFSALLALCLLAAGCIEKPRTSLYRDLQAGFSLVVPAGWQMMRAYGDVELILTPPQAVGMATRIAVQRDTRKDAQAVDLESYANFRLARVGHFGQQRKLLSQSREALNEALSDAFRADIQYQMNQDQVVRTRSWFLVSGQQQYTLSFTAPDAEFAEFENTWAQFESQFRLLN